MSNLVVECKCKSEFCSSSYEIILKNSNYYLLNIPSCIKGYYSMCEFIEIVLNKKAKETERYTRGYNLDEEFKKTTIESIKTKRYINEINYIYYNASGKKFIIKCRKPYIDYVFLQEKRDESFKKMKNILIDNKLDFLIDYLIDLHSNNYYKIKDYTLVNSVDDLIKQINKQIS